MADPEQKERFRNRRRNVLAERMRRSKLFHERKREGKKPYNRRKTNIKIKDIGDAEEEV